MSGHPITNSGRYNGEYGLYTLTTLSFHFDRSGLMRRIFSQVSCRLFNLLFTAGISLYFRASPKALPAKCDFFRRRFWADSGQRIKGRKRRRGGGGGARGRSVRFVLFFLYSICLWEERGVPFASSFFCALFVYDGIG